MSMSTQTLRAAALTVALLGAGCGGDDDSRTAHAGAPSAEGSGGEPLYAVTSNVTVGEDSTLYLWSTRQFDNAQLDLKQAREIPGGGTPVQLGKWLFVPNSEEKSIMRFEVQGDQLVEGPALSLKEFGLRYVSYVEPILNAERAFLVSSDLYKIIEWNPTTMTLTRTHDIGALKREGWGAEYRGGFVRDDGKFIFYWTYTNRRVAFINNLVIGVWDAATSTLTIEEDPTCPASAGFGGYFDEQGDLYLIADSFGLFTEYGGFPDAKPACVRRVKKGENRLDPGFVQHPADAMGGFSPWGFYDGGNGQAFTIGIDPAVARRYDAVFEILFAKEHGGWLYDTKTGTARKIENLPKDGAAFESYRTDGRLLVPRTSGSVVIENIMSTESTLYEVKPDATATKVLSLPGYVTVLRMR